MAPLFAIIIGRHAGLYITFIKGRHGAPYTAIIIGGHWALYIAIIKGRHGVKYTVIHRYTSFRLNEIHKLISVFQLTSQLSLV
jgi:hypothetical protein